VVTTDFFPPIVDDPYMFGQIAAANALSDISAMGGRPIVALNLLCCPLGKVSSDVMYKILLGGHDKVTEAGAVIAGGHSVKDTEIKYGLAVTGMVENVYLKTNAGARPGDRLLLTKALGTGIISTAMKRSAAGPDILDPAIAQMARLNRLPDEILKGFRISSITDITGFALVGHSLEMAEASGVAMRFELAKLPILKGALELAAAGFLTGGGNDNRKYRSDKVVYEKRPGDPMIHLLHDPQTSGGLLIAVNSGDAGATVSAMKAAGLFCVEIGECVSGTPSLTFF